MCSIGQCTHFHATNRRNEDYIKKLREQQLTHTFVRDGLATKVFLPHGNPIESVHVIIKGKVQGVHFQAWANEQAVLMTVNGWIRYLTDGSIEAVFSGKPAAVDRLLDHCKEGPMYARVKEIIATVCDRPPGKGFQRLPIHDLTKGSGRESITKPKPARRESSKFKLKRKTVLLSDSFEPGAP